MRTAPTAKGRETPGTDSITRGPGIPNDHLTSACYSASERAKYKGYAGHRYCMRSSRGFLAAALLVGLALLAGRGVLFGTDAASKSTETVTPAPVSEPTPTATPTPEDSGMDDSSRRGTNQSAAVQERYRSLRPTCDRPPGLVIHIQVAALQNNDRATNAGINTT